MRIDAQVKEEKEQKEEEKKPNEPEFHDIESSYLYWRNYLPETPYQEYIAKKKCVTIGKELLRPIGMRAEEIRKVYKKAKEALKQAKPGEREISFKSQDIAGGKYPIYYLEAEDAGKCQAETERLDDVRMDFKNQQYETIVGNLQDVDDEILHELVVSRIIPVEAINPERIIDKVLREGGFDVLFKEDIPEKSKERKSNEREETPKEMESISSIDSDIIPPGIADDEIFSDDESENDEKVNG